jgi:hypothetical protein
VNPEQALEHARAVSRANADRLLAMANVVGVGVGYRGGARQEVALVVMVNQKLPRTQLREEDLLPQEIEGIPVEVRVVGELRAQNANEGTVT